MKARLRDFIVTDENYIFAVVDYSNSQNGIRSILRYIPDENGDRVRSDVRFRKCDFDEAFAFMRNTHPDWVGDVHIIPEDHIRELLRPPDRIAELAESDKRVSYIVDVLRNAGIPLSMMGVTGSLLPGLQVGTSDIDFVVYGNEWFHARDTIEKSEG